MILLSSNSDTSFEHLSNYFESKTGSRSFISYRIRIVLLINLRQVCVELFHSFLVAHQLHPPPKTQNPPIELLADINKSGERIEFIINYTRDLFEALSSTDGRKDECVRVGEGVRAQ